jgi:hypothetical protein
MPHESAHLDTYSLKDVIENVNEYYDATIDGVLPYVAGPHIDSEIPFVNKYGLTDDDKFPPTFKRKFCPGDVLLHSRGVEKIAAVDCVGVTGEKLFILRSKDERILSQDFVLWLLRAPGASRYLESNVSGSVNKFLNWGPLGEYKVSLPSLSVQKEICNTLFKVYSHEIRAINPLSQAIANLIPVLTEPLFSTDPCLKIGDYYYLQKKRVKGIDVKNSPFFVGLENIGNTTWQLVDPVNDQTLDSQVTPFEAGDVLYGKLRPNLRKVTIAPRDGYCSTEILVLKPKGISSEELQILVSSDFVFHQAQRATSGSVMPRVPERILGSIPVGDVSNPSLNEKMRLAIQGRRLSFQLAKEVTHLRMLGRSLLKKVMVSE